MSIKTKQIDGGFANRFSIGVDFTREDGGVHSYSFMEYGEYKEWRNALKEVNSIIDADFFYFKNSERKLETQDIEEFFGIVSILEAAINFELGLSIALPEKSFDAHKKLVGFKREQLFALLFLVKQRFILDLDMAIGLIDKVDISSSCSSDWAEEYWSEVVGIGNDSPYYCYIDHKRFGEDAVDCGHITKSGNYLITNPKDFN